jgi:hypothetical protein
VIPYPAIVVAFPLIQVHGILLAFVAVAAFPVIDIPAVQAEILVGLIAVILAQFQTKLVAFTIQFTSSF